MNRCIFTFALFKKLQ